MKISEELKDRLMKKKMRYHANDNISEVLKDGDKQKLIDEVAEGFESVLQSLVIDTKTDPNSNGTAKRMAKMYVNEIMSGRYEDFPVITSFPNENGYSFTGMLTQRVDFKSLCSHHHQTVSGTAFISLIPADGLPGLSKYIRAVRHIARRGSLQEQMTTDIANMISDKANTLDVGVYVEATHGCITCRGVMQENSMAQTTVLLGGYKTDPSVRQEFFSAIQMAKMESK